jgi:hypothetical protein
MLLMQRAWVQSTVRKLDPTKNLDGTTEKKKKKIPRAATKTWHSQINKYLKKKWKCKIIK